MEYFSTSSSRNNFPSNAEPDLTVLKESARRSILGDTTFADQAHLPPHLEVTMMLSTSFPMAKVISRSKYSYRRSWDHIRENKENVIVFLYIKRGSISVSQQGKTCELKAGDLAFVRSNVPMRNDGTPGVHEPVEFIFIFFPLEVVHRYFPNGVPLCTRIATPTDRQIATPQILSMLCEVGESADRAVIDSLAAALLKETSLLADQQGINVEARQSIGEKRIEDIISYLAVHLANPELSLSMVAEGCKISPRYLCHLLKEHKTTFSQLLWTGRLNESKKWLLNLDKRHYGISEIAYMSGYKSVAHFSRMFREKFGCSPREFRRQEAGGVVVPKDSGQLDPTNEVALVA